MAMRKAGGERGIRSAVVLVNGPGGGELRAVHDILTGVLRIPSVLLESTGFGTAAVSVDPETGVLTAGGRRVRPAVLWARHCAPSTLAARAVPAVAAAAWSGALTLLAAAAGTTLPGAAPFGTTPAGAAPAGTAQLRDARRLGVRVPRTVVTTDLAAAGPLGSPRVIVKIPDFRLVEPDPRRWGPYLPAVLDAGALPGHRTPPGCPVVLQEYVPHTAELRVYVVDGTLCAFRVGKRTPAALWTDPAGVTVTRVDCPPAAAAAVRLLAAAWGLRYAAFDLLVTDREEVVFLEANPDGDWLFFERRAGWHGLSLLAAFLARAAYLTAEGERADDRAAA